MATGTETGIASGIATGMGGRKFRFGEAGRTRRGAPDFGRRYDGGRVAIGHSLMRPYEINFCAPQDVISIPFGVIEGTRAYNSDRRVRLATRPGDLIFHPAGATVYVDAPERVCEFLSFAIDPGLRAEIGAEAGPATGAPGAADSVLLKSAEAVGIAQLTRRFMLGGHPGGRLAAESLGILALTEVLSALSGKLPPPAKGLDARRLRRILDYIDVHRGDDIGLGDLAQVCGLTAYHFARAFKQATGVTPHRYLLERRLSLACELLATVAAPIAEVARAAGFASQAHMTDTFRRVLGTTPGRYRQATASWA